MPDRSRSTRRSCACRARAGRRLEEVIDWGPRKRCGFGSLLVKGTPVGDEGQDTAAGPSRQRHPVLYDARTGKPYAPIKFLADGQASIRYHDCRCRRRRLGFEYGYSLDRRSARAVGAVRRLRERRPGDHRPVHRLRPLQVEPDVVTLLLHWLRGERPRAAPSARAEERFLQSAAQENIRIANPSTAARCFHLLRRQSERTAAAARGDDTEGPPPPTRVRGDGEEALVRVVYSRPRRSGCRPRPRAQARVLLREALLRHLGPRRRSRGRPTWPSFASTSSTRSRRAPSPRCSAPTAVEEIVWAQKPLNMGGYRSPTRGCAARRRAAALRRPAHGGRARARLSDSPPGRAGAHRPRSARLAARSLTAVDHRQRLEAAFGPCFFACSKTSRRCAGLAASARACTLRRRARWCPSAA